MVGRARLRVGQRVDEGERPARLEPAPDDRQERVEPGARDVAQPEAGEHGVDLAVGLGPRVADVEVRPQAVGDEALAGTVERRLVAVVQRQLALAGEQRRPPAGARPRARRSRRRSAARRASGRRCRARRSRRCRGPARVRSGRGADTSRRTRRRGPRSRRASRRRVGRGSADWPPLARPLGSRCGGGVVAGLPASGQLARLDVVRRGSRPAAQGVEAGRNCRCRRPCPTQSGHSVRRSPRRSSGRARRRARPVAAPAGSRTDRAGTASMQAGPVDESGRPASTTRAARCPRTRPGRRSRPAARSRR